ncbi:MAG TPA: hypothetical protein VH209_08725 [Steroidobacteraceae bacterium]|jgi:hypothetical protein|nr:hypothetical protein [Steroidobacteraceae bacterium]
MRFPTWLRFAQLLERFSQGSFPIGFYYPQPPTASAAPCSRQRPLCSLQEAGPKGVEPQGVRIRWMNAR